VKKRIVKQDINFLEYPNWVIAERGVVKNFQIVKDNGRYEISTAADRLPGRLDKTVLYYLLFELFSNPNPGDAVVQTSRYAIARGIANSTVNDQLYRQVMRALKRWHGIQIVFVGSFYDGTKEKSTRYFHVIDDVVQIGKSLKVVFNKQFIEQTMNSNYFRNIDFNEYKRLKRPISVRLYEILSKTFSERDAWRIDSIKLGEKLTLSYQYPSQIIRTIKPAINEINKNTDFDISIEFNHKKDQTIITFKKNDVSETNYLSQAIKLISPNIEKDRGLLEIIETFDGEWKVLRSAILFSNMRSNANYKAFLKKALANDWGKSLREEDERLEKEFSDTIEEAFELTEAFEADRGEKYELIMSALREMTAIGTKHEYINADQVIKKIEMMID